ncbi:hypothetical protein [Caproicibacter sp.]|uniref:hypothetical protein n=1 Tax=Caproicibacter sp. TaxID=2814884 RepID=UPI0039899895
MKEELTGDFSGDEVTASLSYMADSTSNWNDFEKSTVTSHIDGIKIQTGTNKPYYLSYKTWNSGKSSYYPPVKSTVDDYAGSAGKPVQRLNIQAFKNDGTKLSSGVIVMYRAYVNGEWLPWVSNADPEWMRNVRNKYSLGGTLDTGGSFAGIAGEDISGVEIRIFEDDSLNAGTDDFSGDELNLSLSYMADSNNNWTGFSENVTASHIDGIHYDEGIKVNAISKAVRVSTSAIYRLLKKKQKTGTIEPSYENSGRQSEVTPEKLAKMEALIAENSDITLAEIKEAMQLSIQKSEISNILRNKLGFRYKKRWYMPASETGQM